MTEWDLNNDSRMGFAIMVGGWVYAAIVTTLGLAVGFTLLRVILRSAWAERVLNSGHYGAGKRKDRD